MELVNILLFRFLLLRGAPALCCKRYCPLKNRDFFLDFCISTERACFSDSPAILIKNALRVEFFAEFEVLITAESEGTAQVMVKQKLCH